MSFFEIGSIICGAAPTMDALIVGRVVAGIGGSGIYIGYSFFLGSKKFSVALRANAAKHTQLFDSSYLQPGARTLYVRYWPCMGCWSHTRTCCWRRFLPKRCNLAMGFLYKPVSKYRLFLLIIPGAHRCRLVV